jgi:hypothetical protein
MVMFSTLLPNVPFEPPFDPEPVPADPKLMAAVLRGDALLHQQLCYPLDLSGAPWCGLRAFTPELFLDEITRLKSDIERISSIVFGENDD